MKYVKPNSVTWWTGVANLGMGAALATEPFHGVVALSTTIDNLTGGVQPHTLLTAGFGLVGLRAAL